MDEETRDVLLEANTIYEAWYSTDNIGESHARNLFLLGCLGYFDASNCIAHGVAKNTDEAARRMASLLFAAYQMGRASVDV